jgi:lysophospholipase L1-like esterase
VPTGGIAATTVQAALAELDTEKATTAALTAHLDDTTDAHDASAISLTPIAALGNPANVQEALAAVPGRFLPQGPLDGRRWIIVGDSNSALGTATIGGKSWTTFAPRMSGGKLYEAWDNGFYETNLATSGHTSTQQLATLNAFLTANPGYLPTLVSVMVGTNDVRDSSDPATWQANLAAYVTAVRAVSPSCQFVFHTLPPRSGPTSAVAPAIIEDVWNAWLRTWVAANGHTLVDVWRLVTDPATREFRSGVFDTSDGVHINAAGQYLIGQEYQRVVTPRLSTPPLTGDPRNLVPMSLTDPHNFEPPGIFTWAQDPADRMGQDQPRRHHLAPRRGPGHARWVRNRADVERPDRQRPVHRHDRTWHQLGRRRPAPRVVAHPRRLSHERRAGLGRVPHGTHRGWGVARVVHRRHPVRSVASDRRVPAVPVRVATAQRQHLARSPVRVHQGRERRRGDRRPDRRRRGLQPDPASASPR